MVVRFLFSALLTLVLTVPATTQEKAAPPASPPQVPKDEDVLARVGAIAITRADHRKELNRLIPLTFFHAKVDPARKREMAIQALDSLVEKALIYQDAMTRGLVASEEAIREEFVETLEKAGAQYANVSEEQFEKLLEAYRPMVVRRVLLDANEARFEASLRPPTDDELLAGYEANREVLMTPEKARFLHILMRVDPAASDEQAREVYERMEKIVAALTGGASFGDLAKEHSEDIYAARRGDMGFVVEGEFAMGAVGKAAFALEDGETSEILTSIYGFHVIRRVESQPRRSLTFAEARDALVIQVANDKQVRARAAWIKGIRESVGVEVLIDWNEVPLETVPREPGGPGSSHGHGG